VRRLRRASKKRLLLGFGGIVTVIGVAVVFSIVSRAYHPCPLKFDGDSTRLGRTQVVPTLDWPVEAGKNVVWCASFLAAWKRLQTELAREPVRLTGAERICAALNASPVPEVPDSELYTAVGWENKGVLEEIQREKERLFPGSRVPTFPRISAGSFVAYG